MTRKLVLVVDDDPGCALVLSLLVERCGFRVQVARNGAEGLAMMEAHRPDLVLLDMIMPVLNGEGVLAAMRADPGLKDVPVIAVSTVESLTEGLADDVPHMRKPYSPAEVRRLMLEALGEPGEDA